MVRVQVPADAHDILKTHREMQGRTTANVQPSSEMLTFRVTNKEDAALVAAYFGLEIPQGRGRFPIQRLRETVALHGHKLDTTSYGSDSAPNMPGTWRVTLMEQTGGVVIPRTGLVNSHQLRAFHSGRGRASSNALASAAIAAHGWGTEYLADSVSVRKVD